MEKMKYINENRQKNIKIPDNIINIIDNINKKVFQYIKDNLKDIKIIEKKLLLIDSNVKILFHKNNKLETNQNLYKSEILFNSYDKINSFTSQGKPKILKRQKNENIKNQNKIKEMNSIKYLNFKLKKKLKQDHDQNKIKELEYLERIAILQCKLNLYERYLEKLILEKKSCTNIKQRNNSLKNINNNYYLNNKNSELDKIKERNLCRPYSSTIDEKISNLKKNVFESFNNNRNNNSAIDTYISANTNTLDSYLNRNKKRNYRNSLNDLHYKYQIGNNYLRNDFKQIKKTIHKNNCKINKLMNNYVKAHK